VIEDAFAEADADTWEERLNEAGAPCSRINSLADAVNHPQLAHRDVVQNVESPHGDLTLIGSGFRLNEGTGSIDRAPALLGEHTDEILAEAGYSDGEVADMRASGLLD
jgi:crotonobetainyl-CoA:carnitine CoA-transferase CaiB-like acyl-CoA transferase